MEIHRTRFRLTVALICVVTYGGLAGLAWAALPGESLYPLKTRVLERIEKIPVWTLDQEERLLARRINRRIEEARRLAKDELMSLDRRSQLEMSIQPVMSRLIDIGNTHIIQHELDDADRLTGALDALLSGGEKDLRYLANHTSATSIQSGVETNQLANALYRDQEKIWEVKRDSGIVRKYLDAALKRTASSTRN